jgi:O-antigen/teichoic acid export membrane protein
MTRILIRQLGLELFGLLTTVGASGMLVSMFTNILQLSIARELGVTVGEANSLKIKGAFSSAFFVQSIIALITLIIGYAASESIVNGLTIPEGYFEITWFCILITFLQLAIGIFTSPFAAMIRAYQDLKAINFLQILLKVLIFASAVSMIFWKGEKLLFFVTANLICFSLIQVLHIWYARRKFDLCRAELGLVSKPVIKSIFRYASFALIGGIGGQIRRNGVAIILNIYFGNIVTAANGIAIRLSNLIAQFVGTITPVVQPAMNSNFGAGNKEYIEKLIPISSTIGLAIIIPLALPLISDTEALLIFWLQTDLPPFAVLFSQLLTLTFVVTMISKGHAMAMHADGNIGWLTIVNQVLVIGGIFGFAIIACTNKENPWLLTIGELFGLIIATSIWQPIYVAKKLNISNKLWIRKTVLPALIIIITNGIIFISISSFIDTSVGRAILLGALSSVVTFSILWLFAFENTQRENLKGFMKQIVTKTIKRTFL